MSGYDRWLAYYRRDGTQYPPGIEGMVEWGRDFQNPDIHFVKQDRLPNGYFISTVWLGIDHRWDVGSPLIFETMVFIDDSESLEYQRYSTESDAIIGHIEMLDRYKDKPKPRKPGRKKQARP